jgi:hypothetical protein
MLLHLIVYVDVTAIQIGLRTGCFSITAQGRISDDCNEP